MTVDRNGCSHDNCEGDKYPPTRGMCRNHYVAFKRDHFEEFADKYGWKRCSVCNGGPLMGKGLCVTHYTKLLHFGSATAVSEIKTHEDDVRAFMAAAVDCESSECLEPPQYKQKRMGYSTFTPKGESSIYSHVWVTIQRHGPRPDGMQACHSCGNGRCVNGSHLRWDTLQGNANDKFRHGTVHRGEKNPRAKVSDAQADAIRIDTRKGVTIAAEYGISPAQVSLIRSGKSRAPASLDRPEIGSGIQSTRKR